MFVSGCYSLHDTCELLLLTVSVCVCVFMLSAETPPFLRNIHHDDAMMCVFVEYDVFFKVTKCVHTLL